MDDAVNHPAHYTAFPVEVIEIIKATLGRDGFRAYCFGNEIKYRMRAGLKGEKASEDLDKAMTYKRFREVADEDPIFTTQSGTTFCSKWADFIAQVESKTAKIPAREDLTSNDELEFYTQAWRSNVEKKMDDLRKAIFEEA